MWVKWYEGWMNVMGFGKGEDERGEVVYVEGILKGDGNGWV